jgi:hypothetical protein
LSLTHWVMVNNSTNINKNYLSPQLIEWWSTISQISANITSHLITLIDGNEFRWEVIWYWWNCWPSLNELKWEIIFVDIGGIVDHHSMNLDERWFLTNIDKNHLSSSLIEWWSTIPPISTKITSHLNSLSDGKQFHQYQQKSPLTSTHWVMSIITPIMFADIGGIVDHHSMSLDER